MSASPPKSTSRGYSHKRKKSEEEDAQRKRPVTSSQQQPINQRFTQDVGDPQGREVGNGESTLNSDGGDVQSRDITDPPSISMFPGASNFQVSNTDIIAVGGDAMFIRFGDGQFTEVQRNLIGDYIAKHIVLPAINENSKNHILTQLVILLPRAEAVFNDYQTKKKSGPCFEGTRVILLKEMADWVTGQDESRMYILSGLAGIGKSTVAYTIASRADDLHLLGASFFFSRDEADRNNAKKFFTTIAYQLCVYEEQFAKAIGDALQTERGSAAATKCPQEQLQLLILDPLRIIVQLRARPILIVVDALDECCEEDIRPVIHGLGQLVRDLPSFKVILTARPHSDIDYFLGYQDGHKLFRLQDIEDKIVDGDIRLFLKHNLSLEKVRERFPRQQWGASDEEIDTLVCATGRLFIIAATSVRYILDKSASNPAAQMQELLGASAQDRTSFKDLNDFYTIILRNAVPADCDSHKTITRYQSVVGAIILVQHPLPVSILAQLLNIDIEEIRVVLDHLQSVILLGDNDVPRVYHKSFPDYLTDKTRCKDSHLQIDPNISHQQIAKRCFEIANEHLKYNILGFGTPARFMSNEDGLKEDGITEDKFQEKIPQQLCYACIYWVAHLNDTNIENTDIKNGLNKFMNDHVLHWFEVLSLLGKLDGAHRAIRTVLNLLKSTSSDLHQLLSDALRFISKFYEIINQSALHIYYSALPFTPTESLLYHRYIKEAEHGICTIEGGPQKWNAIVADLNHGEQVHHVKFSLNSNMLVSYSQHYVYSDGQIYNQGKLNIWDAFTGTPISTIPGHKFAVSNDFATVASSKDNLITCYNLDRSTTGTTMVTTSSRITELAVSCESNRIAAFSFDGNVSLWKCTSGELISRFDGDKGEYWHVLEFSPSGKRFVYSSPNSDVKLLDGISGGFIADLPCGSYSKLEFSADSSRIATVSKNNSGLTLWNSESGGLITAANVVWEEDYINLAISTHGSLLAMSNRDKVTLWSENSGQLIEIGVVECDDPVSIALSSDNLLAICDIDNIKIYNIETRTMSTLLSKSYEGSDGPATFSPDGTRFACGTLLFDIHAIRVDTSGSSSRKIWAVALSHNCLRLACGFYDGTIELWGTSPGMRRIASHQCHDSWIWDVVFGPDSRLFASMSNGGTVTTVNLWNSGDGSLYGTINHESEVQTVTLSNSLLIAGGKGSVTLWDLGRLSLIHTFKIHNTAHKASISDDSDLAAIACNDNIVYLVNLTNRTTSCIAKLEFHFYNCQSLAFLPDKSHLLAQSDRGEFQSLNLVNNSIANEHLLEHLVQLPSTPLWHGIPVSVYQLDDRNTVLCSLSKNRVPLLRVPTDHAAESWAIGSSRAVIALSCRDGQIILLRLRTSSRVG